MKSSASQGDLTSNPPPPPKLKRAVTYSNERNESGEFTILIQIPTGYISENAFYALSPDSTLSSPIGTAILDNEEEDEESIIIEEEEENTIVIHYPSASTGDIWAQLHEFRNHNFIDIWGGGSF